MRPAAVIFDLDGTLLDTLADIADVVNDLLAQRGFKQQPLSKFPYFVGDGVRELLQRAILPHKADDALLDELALAFATNYANSWHNKTKPYPGVEQVLTAFARAGVKLAVLSNKPHAFCKQMTDYYFKDVPFTQVVGAQNGIPLKPNPALALQIATSLGLPPAQIAFVGDSDIDINTAINAGMYAVGAGWGFRGAKELQTAGAKLVFAKPMQLINLLAEE